MLGRAWREELDRTGVPYLALGRDQLDVTDAHAVQRRLTDAARTVINCSAWTDVDGSEEHEDDATRLNGKAVGLLADRCAEIGALLIHYSTDYVFAGDAALPYRTDAPLNPVSAYGRSKAAGERAVLSSGCRHLLIRTSWLYAPWGKNFVRTMLKLTAERDELKVVDDQRGRPTSAQHLAAASHRLLQAEAEGIFHVTDSGECTWFEFAQEIAAQAGHTCSIHPCSTDQFPRPAKRPAYSTLDLASTETVIGPLMDWRTNLSEVLTQIDAAASS